MVGQFKQQRHESEGTASGHNGHTLSTQRRKDLAKFSCSLLRILWCSPAAVQMKRVFYGMGRHWEWKKKVRFTRLIKAVPCLTLVLQHMSMQLSYSGSSIDFELHPWRRARPWMAYKNQAYRSFGQHSHHPIASLFVPIIGVKSHLWMCSGEWTCWNPRCEWPLGDHSPDAMALEFDFNPLYTAQDLKRIVTDIAEHARFDHELERQDLPFEVVW